MLRAGSSWGEEFLQELPEIMQGAPNTEVPFHDKVFSHGFFTNQKKRQKEISWDIVFVKSTQHLGLMIIYSTLYVYSYI